MTAESAGTQGTTTPTPKTLTPEEEHVPTANELIQEGWSGPAELNRSFPITTKPTASSAPAISGDIPTGEPEDHEEMQEAASQHGSTEWNPPSALSSEAGDEVFHTSEDIYQLLRVVFGSVCDLKTQVTALTASNDKLNKATETQAARISNPNATVQLMSVELKRKITTTNNPPPPPTQTTDHPARTKR